MSTNYHKSISRLSAEYLLTLYFLDPPTDIRPTDYNFSTTCQLTVIRVLVGCSRLSVDC